MGEQGHSELWEDRYELTARLKSAGGADTFLARDRHTDADVVLKLAPAADVSAAVRFRLQRDVELLRPLDHKWLPARFEIVADNDVLCLVRPYLPGRSLSARLRQGRLPVPEALSLAREILESLSAAHERGVLHRGVSPSNVVLGWAEYPAPARLVDFGFVRTQLLNGRPDPQALETVRFAAPEQIGLIHSQIDESTDLFSVGLILFNCLTGAPLFDSLHVGDFFRQQLSTPVPRLLDLGVDAPPVLDEILQRLLATNPGDRYQAAQGVMDDVQTLSRSLSAGRRDAPIVVGATDRRRSLRLPALVGRGQQLSTLEDALDRLQAGKGGLVLLEGPPGSGKTRLLDELGRICAGRDIPVYRGRADSRTGGRPFAVLAGVVDGFLRAAQRQPELAEQLRRRVGSEESALGHALPQLRGALPAGGEQSPGPEASGGERSVHAVAAFLDGLGAADGPAVVLLDDCQWVENLSEEVLVRYQQRLQQDPTGHVLLVAARRSDHSPLEDRLGASELSARIQLPPLAGDEIRALAESMAGALPPEALDTVAQYAEGDPFMAEAVVRGLVEHGALAVKGQAWAFDSSSAAPLVSREAGDLLAWRLGLLAPETLALLRTAAVLGREFDLEMLSLLSGLSPQDVVSDLEDAHRRHLIWLRPERRPAFVHDSIREACLEGLSEDDRKQLHLGAAHAIQEREPEAVFELAYQFDAAGDSRQALPFALRAARSARSRFALDIAEKYYRIASRGAVDGEQEQQHEAADGLGQVLMLQGRYDEAVEYLEHALALAITPDARARTGGALGELALKQGRLEEASAALQRALKLLGHRIPASGLVRRVLLVRELLVQLVPRRIRSRRRSRDLEHDRLALHLYGQLVYVWFLSGGGTLDMQWVQLRAVNLADRCPPTSEAAEAYAIHGPAVAAAFPLARKRAAAFVERARSVYAVAGNRWGDAHCSSFRGAVLFAGARYGGAVEELERAIPLLEQTGDRWQLMVARWHRAYCLLRLGRLREAAAASEEICRASEELGDRLAFGMAVNVWAKATGGALPGHVLNSSLAGSNPDVQATVGVLMARSFRLMRSGRPADAAATLRHALELTEELHFRNVYLSPVLPWLATALREVAEADPGWSPRRRRQMLRAARRVARRARRSSWRFPGDRPHALRELGLISALQGRPRRARRLLRKSVAIGTAQEAAYETAQSRQMLGEIGMAHGWSGAAEELDRGRREGVALLLGPDALVHDTMGAAGLSVAQRFQDLLNGGRRLASADSRQDILDAICETGRSLLRTNDVAVVDWEPQRDRLRVLAGGAVPVSRALLGQALEAGGPVLMGDRFGYVAPDAGMAGRFRSAMAVPITTRDGVATLLWAGDRQVGDLFGREEARLAEFIASLAAAVMGRERLRQEIFTRVIEAQERDRARIARDLHDEMGQALTSALLRLSPLLASPTPLAEAEVSEVADEVRQVVADALTEVHRLAFELRPTVLDDLGLVSALERLVQDVTKRNDLEVGLRIDGLPGGTRLPPEVETTAYRVVQEAITNVIRHARATCVEVSVDKDPEILRIAVSDNGQGFDPSRVTSTSLGLRGMAERVESVGGVMSLESAPGEGTTALMVVPVD